MSNSSAIYKPLFGCRNAEMFADYFAHTFMEKVSLVKHASFEDARELFMEFVNPKYTSISKKISAGITEDTQLNDLINMYDTNFVWMKKSCLVNVESYYFDTFLFGDANLDIRDIRISGTLIIVGKQITLKKANILAQRLIIIGERLIGLEDAHFGCDYVYTYDYQTDKHLPALLALGDVWMELLGLNKQLAVYEENDKKKFYIRDVMRDLIDTYQIMKPENETATDADAIRRAFSKMFPNANPEVLQEIVNNAIDKCNNENSNEKPLPAGTNFEQLVVNNIQPVFVQGGAADNSPTIVGEDDVQ